MPVRRLLVREENCQPGRISLRNGSRPNVREPDCAPEEAISLELLSPLEMRRYFPRAKIVSERVAGVPKSMCAIK
jgi:hypothetical protein